MLRTLKLLLPAIIPSWRFFDFVAPSPRIEFRLADTPWREFRPRPARLNGLDLFKRMAWNPHWNESLFLTSCAERILETPTQHSIDEICQRIRDDLAHNGVAASGFQFRLVVISRQDTRLRTDIAFMSAVYSLAGSTAA